MKRVVLTAILGAALAAPAAADRADDDLKAVRKAVLASAATQVVPTPGAEPRPPAEDPGLPPPAAKAQPQPRKGELRWFRVRIVEKAGNRERVSVNLPLGLVRALGEDWPIPMHDGCRKHERCNVTLGEILRALDAGQSLVDIEDAETTVRVWVD
jgi:hypothetical protein